MHGAIIHVNNLFGGRYGQSFRSSTVLFLLLLFGLKSNSILCCTEKSVIDVFINAAQNGFCAVLFLLEVSL